MRGCLDGTTVLFAPRASRYSQGLWDASRQKKVFRGKYVGGKNMTLCSRECYQSRPKQDAFKKNTFCFRCLKGLLFKNILLE